jgi:hypothetical protein
MGRNEPEQMTIKYICSTFYPEDILEINCDDYYKITIKNQHRPIYLQTTANLYDESGDRKSIIDIVHRMGRRRVLGLNDDHEFRAFDIDKVENVTPEDENISVLDTPFYSIGILRDVNDYVKDSNHCVLIDQILVELD